MINPKLLESLSKEDSIRLMVSMIDVISEQIHMLNGEGDNRRLTDAYFNYYFKIESLYDEYHIDPPKSRFEESLEMLEKAVKNRINGEGSDLDEITQR